VETKPVPSHPSLQQYRKQAKDLVKAHKSAAPDALERIRAYHPAFFSLTPQQIANCPFQLTAAQLVLAREHGFESWPKFKSQIETLNFKRKTLLANDPSAVFLEAACLPMGDWHAAGTLETAQALLAQRPEIARSNIYVAAALGDALSVRRLLDANPNDATAKGGPHEWDALTYMCFSRYLRLDHSRSEGFVRAATALLDAGASADTGWYEANDEPRPFWESAIYGAAGIARNVELTRLLLERGANPNDGETPYHVPEGHDNAVMHVLVESGTLSDESMTTLLLRKADWHDYEGIEYLLKHGADPNRMTLWGRTVVLQALQRDNTIEIIRLMLDHGADLFFVNPHTGRNGVELAARRGRRDVLEEAIRRGNLVAFDGVLRLIAACARGDAAGVRSMASEEPTLQDDLIMQGSTLLAEFAGNGNTEGVRLLLDLGVKVNEPYREGDAYFEVMKSSTALHVAAWRARHSTLKLLLSRGASVDAVDARGRTPLALAIRACVDSHWKSRRSLESIEALLEAGASPRGIEVPTGYPEADALLIDYSKRVDRPPLPSPDGDPEKTKSKGATQIFD
jgi:ankyrin repeat protein